MHNIGKPSYKNDRRIEMTAYMGPRRAGKRFFNEHYGDPRDPKDGYPEFWTEQVFQDYKDAGFTFLIPEGDAFFGMRLASDGYEHEPDFIKSDLYRFVKKAEKHGLDVYPSCQMLLDKIAKKPGKLEPWEKEIIGQFVKTMASHFPETCKGVLLTDEPSVQASGHIEEIIAYIKDVAPDMDVFVSMLPIYGCVGSYQEKYDTEEFKNKPITIGMREEAYQNYIDTYGKIMGEFAFDYYPMQCNAKDTLAPTFYMNLEMAAKSGLEHGFPIAVTLQSFCMDAHYNPETGRGERIYTVPSYEDVRYQVYSSLAFGVRRIGYFTFWQHYNESSAEVFPTAMVVYDEAEECGYRKTSIYDAVKKVNEQITSFDHVFLRFNWKGCRVVRKSDDENIQLVSGGYNQGMLRDVSSLRDTLVGCFENPEDGREGYWVVNAQNPYFFEWNEVKLRFDDATHIQYYRAGKEYNVGLDNDGIFNIRLGAGEGIFIIPYIE